MTDPRYLAVLDPLQTGAAEALKPGSGQSARLVPACRGARMTLFTEPEAPVVRGQGAGFLVGRLFPKCGSNEMMMLAGSIFASEGRTLITEYWGDYVCLLETPDGTGLQAIRAPSGTLHAYRIRRGPVTYLTSHIEIALEYGLVTPAIDWAFVAHHLAFLHLPTAATGLAGVDEIMPGEAMLLQGTGSATRALWSPWAFTAPAQRIASAAEAAENLSHAVRQAVGALVLPSDKVLLELSGGLDSSVLAAVLSEAGRETIALNLATPDPGGDERDYACAMADFCGISLSEAQVGEDIDLTAEPSTWTARPGLPAMLRSADALFDRLAKEKSITAFVSGTGGDCVFCSLSSAAPATDYLRSHGLRPRLVALLRDIATIHETNIWNVSRLLMRQVGRGKPALPWARNSQFLKPDRLPFAPAAHPWLSEPDHVLPGTRAHVRAIIAANAHLDGYGRQQTAPSLYPLLAQPVVEACLRIPTWLWVDGGRDRAIARNAFRQSLPEKIVARRTKGSMDAFCARIFDRNRDRLRPFLLDGLLAGAGLLDRVKIETYLSRPFSNRDNLFYHLLPIADTEAWARGMQARSS